MKILLIAWIILGLTTIYYFIPKSVEWGNKDGMWVKITRPNGWRNDIEIKWVEIHYENKE